MTLSNASVVTIFRKHRCRKVAVLTAPIHTQHLINHPMNSDPKPNPIERLTYSVEESAIALGVSKPTIYRLIVREILRPLPGIRHKRIPCDQVRRFAAGEDLHGLN